MLEHVISAHFINHVIGIVMASTAQNPFGRKHFNRQVKYLIMKLWDYFMQEVNKSCVSVNVKKKISKTLGIGSLALQ